MLSYRNIRVVEVGKGGSGNKKIKVTATCHCGKEFDVILSDLKRGNHRSCGCLHGERHGMKGTRPYKIWQGIKARCNNPKNSVYKYYGGKGITICPKWNKSFISFWGDMKDGYSDQFSIDRIDNNKGYCKENCKWSTRRQQAINNSRNVVFNGECASQASERLGGHKSLVRDRIYSGWSKEKAFTTPIKKQK